MHSEDATIHGSLSSKKKVDIISKDLSSTKLCRLNMLMGLLFTGRTVPKQEIIQSLEYRTSRTFERDLDFLRGAYGVEIVYDRKHGGYRMDGKGSFILNFTLSDKEVLSLVAGLRMARHFLPHLEDSAESLWGKMRSAIPESLLRTGDSLGKSAVVSLPLSSMDGRVFAMIMESIEKKQDIRFSYRSPYGDDRSKTKIVSPWGVFFQSHAWYLWGSHDDLPKGATYRISRIKNLIYWPKSKFSDKPEGMEVADHGASGWYGYTGEGKYRVEISIDPPLADVVRETQWHPSQEFLDRPNGGVEMRATVPDIGAVARWIMASAPYASAKEPKELVEKVRELSHKMEERHGHVVKKRG